MSSWYSDSTRLVLNVTLLARVNKMSIVCHLVTQSQYHWYCMHETPMFTHIYASTNIIVVLIYNCNVAVHGKFRILFLWIITFFTNKTLKMLPIYATFQLLYKYPCYSESIRLVFYVTLLLGVDKISCGVYCMTANGSNAIHFITIHLKINEQRR